MEGIAAREQLAGHLDDSAEGDQTEDPAVLPEVVFPEIDSARLVPIGEDPRGDEIEENRHHQEERVGEIASPDLRLQEIEVHPLYLHQL